MYAQSKLRRSFVCGLIGFVAALVSVSADAMDALKPCVELLGVNDSVDDSPALASQPFLTGNQCEAAKRRELRMPLLEIPQQEADPASLAIGTKGDGATLRLKIPFN